MSYKNRLKERNSSPELLWLPSLSYDHTESAGSGQAWLDCWETSHSEVDRVRARATGDPSAVTGTSGQSGPARLKLPGPDTSEEE